MGMDVYANGMAIACKAADGKTIAAFPDVCFTPPTAPPTPPGVPIPYPNTAMASDTTNGSKTVQIAGQEVMLKNKSVFKTSTGDEAGCAPKKGVVTSTNKGEANFICWSMDVKFEGENVPRHLDLMGHNEQCDPTNTPPWPYLDKMALDTSTHPCNKSGDAKKVTDNCTAPITNDFSPGCCDARKCVLVNYSPNKCCSTNGTQKTPHHIVPKSQFKEVGANGAPIIATYKPDKAPCICEDGTSHSTGTHGEIHTETNNATVNHPSVLPNVSVTGKSISPDARWKASEAEAVGAGATAEVTGCDKACLEAQLRSGHGGMGVKPDAQIRPTTAGAVTEPPTNTTQAFE
jgi:Domain of unknown function (DUF4150)/GHH signature containing HNH/Endo VII superfamily nuclease toxin  2